MERTVSTLRTDILPDGTAIGLGLAESLNVLRNSDARSRVVVLLTDGENNAGDITPLQAGQLAKTLGVRVYTIGLVAGRAVRRAWTRRRCGASRPRPAAPTRAPRHRPSWRRRTRRSAALEHSRVGERRFTRFQEFAPWLVGGAIVLLLAEAALRATGCRRYP